MAKNNVKNQNSIQTLKSTMMRKEFWVGLITTFIVLLVGFKLFPWESIPQLTTNKTDKEMSPMPTNSNTATNAANMMTKTSGVQITATPTATAEGKMAKKKVSTLADTNGGYYIVQSNDNYYTISVKVCGNGKNFEYIQADNNGAPLFEGNQIVVTCYE